MAKPTNRLSKYANDGYGPLVESVIFPLATLLPRSALGLAGGADDRIEGRRASEDHR
jgi:hypothetical protein